MLAKTNQGIYRFLAEISTDCIQENNTLACKVFCIVLR